MATIITPLAGNWVTSVLDTASGGQMRGPTAGKTIRFSVPNAVHRKLSSRAAREGLTLSALVLRELEKVATRPTEAEMRRRLAALSLLDRTGRKETR